MQTPAALSRGADRLPGTARRRLSFGINASAAAIAFVVLWWLPDFGGVQQSDVNEFTLACLYATTVVGLNIVFGLAGQISLGPAAVFAVGAYATAITSVDYHWNLWLAVAFGVVAAGIIGVIVAAPSLRVGGFYLAMVTALAAQAVPAWANLYPHLTGSDVGLIVPQFTIGGTPLDLNDGYRLSLGGLAVGVILASNVRSSAWGRWLRSLQASEVATSAIGVPVYRAKVVAFVLSALIGGLAGGLYAGTEGVVGSNQFSFSFSIVLFSALVVGGVGSLWGPVVGTALYLLIPYYFFPLDWGAQAQAIYGGVLIVIMIAAPRGIASLPGSAFDRIRRRGRARSAFEPPTSANSADEVGAAQAELQEICTRARDLEPDRVVLYAENISHHYGGVTALDSVGLTLHAGEIVALIGPNGSGKTTLLNALTGFVARRRGRIEFMGTDITRRPPHRRVTLGLARTFQRPIIFGALSPVENVMTGIGGKRPTILSMLLRLPGHYGFERRARREAHRVLNAFGIYDAVDEPSLIATDLTRHKLLDIARAVATDPIVLLLDEPAAGLSLEQIERVESVIRQLRQAGVAVLLVDHDVAFVTRVADSVVALDRGRVIAAGPPQEVRNHPAVVAAYFGDVGDGDGDE